MTDQQLISARVAALFGVARPAYFATIANAGLLMLVLWESFHVALLLSWFAVLYFGRMLPYLGPNPQSGV